MRGGFNQREMLRVVNSEKVEIHIGDDVSGRRSFRRRIDMPIASAQQQRQEHGGKKKTDFHTSTFHLDSVPVTSNNRHLSETPQDASPRFVGGIRSVTNSPQHIKVDRRPFLPGCLRNLLERCPKGLKAAPSPGSTGGGSAEQRRSRKRIRNAVQTLFRAHRCLRTRKIHSS